MSKHNAIQRAVDKFDGSPTKLAAAIGNGVLRQHVEHWLKSGRVPAEHCRAVQDLTGVKCWELAPQTWHRIWPDLIGSKGAPPVPREHREGSQRATAHIHRERPMAGTREAKGRA